MKLKEGDLVKLKSGGPLMTVESIYSGVGDPCIKCVWFEKITGQSSAQEKYYKSTSLTKPFGLFLRFTI
jgi:uncharacterized protein YodC (DUF2158 family)